MKFVFKDIFAVDLWDSIGNELPIRWEENTNEKLQRPSHGSLALIEKKFQ